MEENVRALGASESAKPAVRQPHLPSLNSPQRSKRPLPRLPSNPPKQVLLRVHPPQMGGMERQNPPGQPRGGTRRRKWGENPHQQATSPEYGHMKPGNRDNHRGSIDRPGSAARFGDRLDGDPSRSGGRRSVDAQPDAPGSSGARHRPLHGQPALLQKRQRGVMPRGGHKNTLGDAAVELRQVTAAQMLRKVCSSESEESTFKAHTAVRSLEDESPAPCLSQAISRKPQHLHRCGLRITVEHGIHVLYHVTRHLEEGALVLDWDQRSLGAVILRQL